MVTKFIILNVVAKETERGEQRMRETKSLTYLQMLAGYKKIIGHILETKKTLFTIGIMVVIGIVTTVNGSFWSVLVTKRLNIAPEYIGWFPVIKSLVMMFFFLVVLPKVHLTRFSLPLGIGFGLLFLSQGLMILSPPNTFLLIGVCMMFEAISLSLINPLLDGLQVIMVNKEERARIIAIVYTMVILMMSPFGSIAGWLASIDLRLPFVMNMVLIALGFILVYKAHKSSERTINI
jgi:energy-converting hydrogenase Eha subunit E